MRESGEEVYSEEKQGALVTGAAAHREELRLHLSFVRRGDFEGGGPVLHELFDSAGRLHW